MKREDYLKIQKQVWLYALTMTMPLGALLLNQGVIRVISDRVTATIEALFLVATYVMLIIIANRLKRIDIHGVTASVLAAMGLYQVLQLNENVDTFWQVTKFLLSICYIFAFVDGTIRLLLSLGHKLRDVRKTDKENAESIESIIAIVTSLIALFISCVELLG
jgi:membrane protein